MLDTFFIIIGLMAITEFILYTGWNKFYYKNGFKIYSKTLTPSIKFDQKTIYISSLEKEIDNGLWPSFQFHRLENNLIAFREKIFSFRLLQYSPIMHGTILIDENVGTVTVQGKTNWYTILLLLFAVNLIFLSAAGQFFDGYFSLFLPLLLLFLYTLQRLRYNRIAKAIESQFNTIEVALSQESDA